MKPPSLGLLVVIWTVWAGIALGATLSAASDRDYVGTAIAGGVLACSAALGLYCYRGLDRR